MKVLHITECFEGGVSRAIHSMVENTPHHTHVLLYKGLDRPARAFSSAKQVDYSALRWDQWHRVITDMVALHRPDVIHAHSSWSGLHTRLTPPPVPVVYQPHCFAFDMRTPLAAAYRIAERTIARNTAVFLTLSAHEAAQARALSRRVPVVQLPNVSTLPIRDAAPAGTAPQQAHTQQPTITMVGRLSPQKDPELFAQIRSHAPREWRFVWIGDGDSAMRSRLTDAGIEVTGWLDADELGERLANADVYVHTARWEGFPLSVLDADACGLPVIARRIPAFDGTQVPVFDSPAEAVGLISGLLGAKKPQPGSQFPMMNRSEQRTVIDAVYSRCAATGAAHVDP